MTTEEQRAEWENPQNWYSGGIYNAPRDSRLWVPKRNPYMGWTVNFAHRAAWWWMIGLLGVPLAIVFFSIWIAAR